MSVDGYVLTGDSYGINDWYCSSIVFSMFLRVFEEFWTCWNSSNMIDQGLRFPTLGQQQCLNTWHQGEEDKQGKETIVCYLLWMFHCVGFYSPNFWKLTSSMTLPLKTSVAGWWLFLSNFEFIFKNWNSAVFLSFLYSMPINNIKWDNWLVMYRDHGLQDLSRC